MHFRGIEHDRWRMKPRKRVLLAAILLAMVLLFPARLALAGNTRDMPFETGLLWSGDSFYPRYQAKEDYTSSWIQSKDGFGLCWAHVVGFSSNGSMAEVGSPRYRVSYQMAGYLVNYVKERGYPNASILFEETGDLGQADLQGFWSPDSL